MKLLHVGLNIQGKEELVGFYRNILGLHADYQFKLSPDLATEIFGIEKQAEVFIYKNETIQFELFVYPEKNEQGFTHICIEVNDREKIVQKCDQAGYPITRIQRHDKTDTLFIRDKAGNIFELKN